jgi:protein-S-isoprenylcysteine O-methyltransferase Ste14
MITEKFIYTVLILIDFALAGIVFITLFFVSAPYGRHTRKGWGATLPNNLGWIIMESPSAILFATLFIFGSAPKNITAIIFLLLWEAHYLHRAFIYPLTISDPAKRMPILITLMGFFFNTFNSYTNARWLFSFSGGYSIKWLLDPRFIVGVSIFIAGFIINRWADQVLRGLRKPGELDYKIPKGGLYRWLSCPNYFGEIIEWFGWALATWSLAGLGFAVWTFANLAPRAVEHHKWYHAKFKEYPVKRKALIPGVF